MAPSRAQLLSATCLATVTMPSARPASREAGAGSLFRPVSGDMSRAAVLAAASVATLAVGAMVSPAQSAFVKFSTSDSNGAFTAATVGGSLLVGDTISGGFGYTYIDGSSYAVTMTAQNTSGSTATFSTSESLPWLSLNGVTSSNVSNNSSDNFDVRISPSNLTRGAFAGAFTFKATQTGKGGTSETATINVSGTAVAPVASTSGDKTVYALAGSGGTTNTTVTTTNIGDGNLSGLGSSSNLSAGTNTGGSGTGWSGTTSNTTSSGDGASRTVGTYTYTAQSTRQSNTTTITSSFANGNPDGSNTSATLTTTLTGVTVAPIASVTSALTFGTVRAGGASTSQTLTVQNKGDGNLAGKTSDYNLRGTVGTASGQFAGAGGALNGSTGLNDSNYGAGATTSANYTFTYAPTARGTHSANVTTALQNGVGNGNASGNVTTTLSGKAVGPVYEAKHNSAGISNYGTVSFTSYGGANVQYKDLMISNITSDTPAGNLTDLSLSFSIIGDPTNEFSISLNGGSYGSTASFVSSAGGLASMIANISIQFNNKVSGGDGFAQLRVSTDEGAAYGGAGAIYIYNLAAVPEPGTIMILGTGLLGFAIARRRRRGPGSEAVRLTARDEDQPPA